MWRNARKNWLVIVIVAVVMVVANWVLIGLPMFYTHDYLHGARIAEFARGITEGQMPVIWSQNFGFGYGMPLFEFYAPLPYLVGAVFYLLGFNLVFSTKLLIFLSTILTMWGGYLWAREFYKPNLAMFSAALVTMASYRAVDIFARGAISEVWAMAALPWLFLGLTRIVKEKQGGFWWAVFGGVILILSHNITTMLVAPFVLFYVILLIGLQPREKAKKKSKASKKKLSLHMSHIISYSGQKVKGLMTLVWAGVTTLGLTAFYLVPAFFEKDLTQVDTWILTHYFDFRLHFLYIRQFLTDNFGYEGSGWGPGDGISFFLGWSQLATLAVSVGVMSYEAICWIKNEKRKKMRTMQEMIFFWGMVGILGLVLLMSTMKAQPIWEALAGLLKFAQFPWRYLSIAVVMLALIAPYGLKFIAEKWQTGLIVLLTIVLVVTSAHYYRGERYLEEPAYYQGEPDFIAGSMSPVLVDYLPRDFGNQWQAVPEGVYVLNVKEQPEVVINRMHEKLYRFKDFSEAATVELPVANYPGWQAEINGQRTEAVTTSKKGNIEVAVPGGDFELAIKLMPTGLRYGSNVVSAISWCGLIGFGIYGSKRKRN